MQYSIEKYIYIINFAYITTTTIPYERRPIQYAREDPWSRYTILVLVLLVLGQTLAFCGLIWLEMWFFQVWEGIIFF